MLMVFFALASFQNLSILSLGSVALKPVHVFSLLFLPLLLMNKEVRINKAVAVFTLFVLAVSLWNYAHFGFDGKLTYYVFGLFVVVIFQNCGKKLTYDDWLDAACGAAAFVMLIVILNDIKWKGSFITFFSQPQKSHPYFPTVMSHLNLESTWLGTFAFAFYKKGPWKWVYACLNMGIALLYGSRCGMIVGAMAILWLFIQDLPKLNTRRNRIILAVILVVGAVVAVRSGMYEAFIGRALRRFLSKGSEIGDKARLQIWQYAGLTIRSYPLGCGAGNGIKALVEASGVPTSEENWCNVYLQAFVEFGWVGGALYLYLVCRMFWNGRKELLSNPFLAALSSYCVVALFQFRGGETIAFFLLAFYLATRKPESAGKNDPDLVVRNPFLRKKGEV